jgi:xylulokinase
VTEDLYLGLDVGSSSTKAVLVGADGVVVADARIEHGISRPRPGWAEQDGERDWWGGALEVCRRVLAGRAARVRAVGVSALGPCVLAADAAGRALRPAILYGIDSRAGAQVERLTAELGADEILARCGSRLSSQSAGPKIRWLADEEPAVWAATRRVFGASSYLAARLTGEYVLDHHSAGHWAPLYDVHANAWIDEWVEQVAPGLELPRLVWPQDECGTVSREAAAATGLPEGTPVVAGSIDSWCEVAASGLRGPGEGLLVYGTSMFLVEVDSPARPDPRLWHTVGFTPGSLNVAAGVASAGALTSWLRDLTGEVPYETLYEEAAGVGPGAGGLLALPYFAGERTPLFDPDLRGAILGLTAAHGRGHIFRALMEAAAFAVRQNLEAMDETGATIARLSSSGGAAAGALWPRIVSDVTGLAQDIRQGPSRAGVGAALLAAIAAGAATLQTRWPQPTVRVEPDPRYRAIYDELYGRFRGLAVAVRPNAHALAVWQRDHARETMPQEADPERGRAAGHEEGERHD